MTAQTGLAVSRDAMLNGTTPKGFRLAIGGLLAGSGVSGTDTRKGVMWDGVGAVVTHNADMSYTVRACRVVVMPSATEGPIIVSNDAPLILPTDPAPGANSRIDIIWCRQHLVGADGGADTDVIGEFGVTQGDTAASPVAPTIPAGAVELARATVTAGTEATNELARQATHLWTCPAGAPVPVRNDTERAALAFEGSLVSHLGSDELQRHNGTEWLSVGAPDDTGWQNITLASGFSVPSGLPAPAVRRIGDVLYYRGAIQRTSGDFAHGQTLFTLSSTFRPPVNTRTQPVPSSSVQNDVGLHFLDTGVTSTVINAGAAIPAYIFLDTITIPAT